ncbi:hypothetical protein F4813DRAFT_384327 [Daldinia decipiens]|uniref:uncharacterized protein n=1 Tax=Daldinia decipiens TaxID=326647 RepID=UPI0020C445A8|nr:uncharacterized protein F4813DRAFT_384327 [Daldinia decipiens]KAI1662748.1 hypothetical protein F4813DRAFT_384327 [Daldinia decipiens]
MPGETGFPLLAQRITINPHYEAFISRKSDRLSARNLLHLESRLVYLEYKLDQADEQAALGSDNETRRSIRAWEAFEQNSEDKTRPEHNRMKLVEEVSERLKEYQEALLRQSQIAALEGPRKRAFDASSRQPILAGLAEKRLSEHNLRDLAAFGRTPDKDLLLRFLQDYWMFKTTKITDGAENINENHVAWVTDIISTVVAAILLLGAIVLLRFLT